MKILFVQTPSLNPNGGGVQRITFNLGVFFTQKGYEVHYFSFSQTGHVEVSNCTLHHAVKGNSSRNPENIKLLTKLLNDNKYSIVINQMPYEKNIRNAIHRQSAYSDYQSIACIHNSLFNFKTNLKDIVTRTFPFPINKLAATKAGLASANAYHKLKHASELKKIIEKHSHVLLYTPPNVKELNYFLSAYNPEKIGCMPNPIPEIPPFNKKKKKTILHVGRINIPQKRSDLLLDFWGSVYKDLEDWNFIIVGDGPYHKILSHNLRERNLPRVELVGFQKPEAYYKEASIFMMPSAYEGFPNTILEAQSNGCPVLAFNSYDALGWIVNDGKDALLSKPFNTTQMGEQAIWLANNTKSLEEFQEAALENAKRFTIEKVGEQWLELFETLLADRAGE